MAILNQIIYAKNVKIIAKNVKINKFVFNVNKIISYKMIFVYKKIKYKNG
jgi:hypothetical protein